MLQTPELVVYAEAFPGREGTDEQWFSHFLVKSVNGKFVVDVRIKKDLLQFNRTAARARGRVFESLDVVVPNIPHPLERLPPPGGVLEHEIFDDSHFIRLRTDRLFPLWSEGRFQHRWIGKAARECT